MVVIAMRVEEEQKFLDPIQAQQHLGMAVGNEAQDVAASGMGRLYVGHDADRCSPVGTHAVDDQIR